MFLAEYYHAGWRNTELFGDFVMILAHWIIHTHNILQRSRNTGYAFEGITSAYEIAKARNQKEAMQDLETTTDQGLYKLGTWQVGGPLSIQNIFLEKHPTNEAIAIDGIMNAKDEAPLRIDTTQRQMHAVMMALTVSASTNNYIPIIYCGSSTVAFTSWNRQECSSSLLSTAMSDIVPLSSTVSG